MLRQADLVETLRAIVLGVDQSTLPANIIAGLVRRKWLKPGRPLALTRVGRKMLAEDGETARRDIAAWLKSDQAKEFFER